MGAVTLESFIYSFINGNKQDVYSCTSLNIYFKSVSYVNINKSLSFCYLISENQDWKNIPRLPERLAPFGIMGVQLKAPLMPLDNVVR